MVPPLLRSALITRRVSVGWGCNMSSISCARIAYVDIRANRILLNAPSVSAAGVRNVIQLFAVALVAASLAACAQSSVAGKKSELLTASRQPSLDQNRTTPFV